jgi:hypothetical protein
LLKLLRAVRDTRERDWLMILVAFWHWLRASEVLAITRENIRTGYLEVQRLKGSNKTRQALVEHDNPLLNEREPLPLCAEINSRPADLRYRSPLVLEAHANATAHSPAFLSTSAIRTS